MTVCLVYPNFAPGSPPLGLAYIAGVLKQNNIPVKIVDCSFIDVEKAVKKIVSTKPDIIGFSSPTLLYHNALTITKMVKKQISTPVCFGGPHPTIFPREVALEPEVDYAVFGEGEATFLELVKCVTTSGDPHKILGLAFSENGEIVVNPPRPPIEDLDKLPLPARELLPIDKYLGFEILYSGKPGLTMMASRGCPFRCTFCQPTLRKIFGIKVRWRSPQNVVDEIEYLKEHYGIKLMTFHDDTFTINSKWAMKVCQEIIDRDLGIEWICNARIDTINEPLLEKMKEAGCIDLRFGVESGNQWVLDNILKKGTKIPKVKEAFKLVKKYKFKRSWAFFMVGSPGETRETVRDSIRLAKELSPTHARVSITMPLPGTEIWDLAEKYGTFDKDWTKHDYMSEHAIISTDTLSKEEVEELAEEFRREFMEQEKISFKLRAAIHMLQSIAWGTRRSFSNRDIGPLSSILDLNWEMVKRFFRYRSLRLSRIEQIKEPE